MEQYKDPVETKPKIQEARNDHQELQELRFMISQLRKKMEEIETRLTRHDDLIKSQGTAFKTMWKKTR